MSSMREQTQAKVDALKAEMKAALEDYDKDQKQELYDLIMTLKKQIRRAELEAFKYR